MLVFHSVKNAIHDYITSANHTFYDQIHMIETDGKAILIFDASLEENTFVEDDVETDAE